MICSQAIKTGNLKKRKPHTTQQAWAKTLERAGFVEEGYNI